jgi:catechol 2,3-dioxygenase-like lactoylglutathione lyase family enzyme
MVGKVEQSMQIEQCLHTAILVCDLEKAAHFYGEVLGLAKVERSLKFPGIWYQVGAYQIHLIVAPTAASTTQNPAIQNSEKWGRNPHIAFAVADLDAAKQKLLHHNCPIQVSASGRAALFTQDPDGNIIELSQRSGSREQGVGNRE